MKWEKRPFVSMILLVAIGSPLATADAQDTVSGAAVFKRCAMCHANTAGAPAKLGPNLAGVFGRQAGRQPGYSYSPAMAAAGFKWNTAKLDAFLAAPQQVVKGTKMPFAGLSDAKDRQDVIAYLRGPKAGH